MSTDGGMNEMQVFDFKGHEVRTITGKDGEPWWVADDVCSILTIANSRDATSKLDEDERGVAIADTPGGPQGKQIINESGLYSLILRSRKPEAKVFKKWVTSEVLPALRKTGRYEIAGGALPALPPLAEMNSKLDAMQLQIARLSIAAEPARRRASRPRSIVPHGHYRLIEWAKRRGIALDPGGETKAEAQRCIDISADLVLPVHSCQLAGERHPANAYHELALIRWLKGYCNRHRLQRTEDLDFGPEYAA